MIKLNPYKSIISDLIPSFIVNTYFMLKYKCKISRKAEIQLTNKIIIGKNTRISSFAKIKVNNGVIKIGENCTINSFCFIYADKGGLEIGNNVLMGPGVGVFGSNYECNDVNKPIIDQGIISRGIKIEDDVWIGSNSTILDGVTIGRGSIIGAGSVVTKDIPPFSSAFGVPAKVIKKRK